MTSILKNAAPDMKKIGLIELQLYTASLSYWKNWLYYNHRQVPLFGRVDGQDYGKDKVKLSCCCNFQEVFQAKTRRLNINAKIYLRQGLQSGDLKFFVWQEKSSIFKFQFPLHAF